MKLQDQRLKRASILFWRVLSCIMVTALAGCSLPFSSATPAPTAQVTQPAGTQTASSSNSQLPAQAEITFQVTVPQSTASTAKIDVAFLDEVTGLAVNGAMYRMQSSGNHIYTVKIPVDVGTVIKYRYLQEGDPPAIEFNATGAQVRYRVLAVNTPTTAQDQISAWFNSPYQGGTGRITGQAVDAASNAPIPDILVTVAGMQTVTASDGSFVFDKAPEGIHNLTFLAMDGGYLTYQQGAKVVAGMVTPAKVSLTAAKKVSITFNVEAPKENVVGLPIRMAGSLLSLGNTYSDLSSGLSTVGSRMPLLSQSQDGKYSITLSLPAGAYIEYKYTLGDGFWNGELSANGQFRLRHLVVPQNDTVVQDTIATWRAPNSGPITFSVKAPDDTPTGENVAIQFNPFGWTEPVPMWALGNNQYIYILFNPQNLLSQVGYRFCRNSACGSADDAATAGQGGQAPKFNSQTDAQTIQYEIKSWNWWQPSSTPTTIPAADIQSRPDGFVGGVQLDPAYKPSWQMYFGPAFQKLNSIGANWVVFSPTWTYTAKGSAIAAITPGQDMLWSDLTNAVAQARNQGLSVAIAPTFRYASSETDYWQSTAKDANWWQDWFDNYRTFSIHYADLAAQTGASTLILGSGSLAPAMPGGTLADGSSSGVPEDAAARWENILTQVRAHFSGTIYWAMDYPGGVNDPPAILDAVDGIYLQWSSSLTSAETYTENDLETAFSSALDQDVQPFQQQVGKPIVLAVMYPSATGAAHGCISQPSGECLAFEGLSRAYPDTPSVSLNLQEQVDIYNALFAAVNTRTYISGIVAKGFYPPAVLEDKSASLYGKPAMDVLWYWFPKMIQKVQ